MLKVIEKPAAREASEELLPLDEIAREGARRMLIEALKAEADDYVVRHRGERDEQGRALVVRNGRGQGRKLTLGAGTVELKAPRVDDRRRDEQGGRQRFTSRILPRYMRRSPKVAEVLPILYLRGLPTGDFRPALEGLLGEDAGGLGGGEADALAKGIDRIGQADRGGDHLVAHQLDIGIGAAGIFGRDGMGAEQGGRDARQFIGCHGDAHGP